MADTKKKFIDAYSRPIPSIYNTVVQELLVQQHFIRYAINYKYNPVSWLLGYFKGGVPDAPSCLPHAAHHKTIWPPHACTQLTHTPVI